MNPVETEHPYRRGTISKIRPPLQGSPSSNSPLTSRTSKGGFASMLLSPLQVTETRKNPVLAGVF